MRRMFRYVWGFCVLLSFAIVLLFTTSNINLVSERQLTDIESAATLGAVVRNYHAVGREEDIEQSRQKEPEKGGAINGFQYFDRNGTFHNKRLYESKRDTSVEGSKRHRSIDDVVSEYNQRVAKLSSNESSDNSGSGQEHTSSPTSGRDYYNNKAFGSAVRWKNENRTIGNIVSRDPASITMEQYYKTVRRDKAAPLQWKINRQTFNYITQNPDVCQRKNDKDNLNVFLLVMVPTAVTNHDKRSMIRKMWGKTSHYSVKVRVVFLVGKPRNDSGNFLQGALFEEQSLYRDLVQEDFLDTYENLTYKTLSGLKWVSRYCPKARYLLKVDDHVFVNMPRLIEELISLPYHPAYIIGNVRYEDEVHRAGRWLVTYEEWPMYFYPVFVVGPAYILSIPLAIKLSHLSSHVPFYRLEDVYTTGFVPLLATSPVPSYVQWDSRYHINEDDFVQSFTGYMYGKYFFSHCENTEAYPGVWRWIERHILHKSNQDTENFQKDHGRIDQGFQSRLRNDSRLLDTDITIFSGDGSKKRSIFNSDPSRNVLSESRRLERERSVILESWKNEKDRRNNEIESNTVGKGDVNVDESVSERTKPKFNGLLDVALNAALWLKQSHKSLNNNQQKSYNSTVYTLLNSKSDSHVTTYNNSRYTVLNRNISSVPRNASGKAYNYDSVNSDSVVSNNSTKTLRKSSAGYDQQKYYSRDIGNGDKSRQPTDEASDILSKYSLNKTSSYISRPKTNYRFRNDNTTSTLSSTNLGYKWFKYNISRDIDPVYNTTSRRLKFHDNQEITSRNSRSFDSLQGNRQYSADIFRRQDEIFPANDSSYKPYRSRSFNSNTQSRRRYGDMTRQNTTNFGNYRAYNRSLSPYTKSDDIDELKSKYMRGSNNSSALSSKAFMKYNISEETTEITVDRNNTNDNYRRFSRHKANNNTAEVETHSDINEKQLKAVPEEKDIVRRRRYR